MAELAVVAAVAQAAGGLIEGIETNNAMRAGARVDEENARLTLLEGEQEGLQTSKEQRRQAGDMLASMGSAGIQLGSGSAADMLAESAYQGELEKYNIRVRAAREAQGLNQAAADKRRAGRAAIVKSVFGVAATALNAASDSKRQSTMTSQWEKERRVPPVKVAGGQ